MRRQSQLPNGRAPYQRITWTIQRHSRNSEEKELSFFFTL
jgi:hypothetical protein